MQTAATMRPGSHWSDPAYLFDFYCAAFAGYEFLPYESWKQALRIARRVVALGAFDSVEELVAAADARVAEVW